MSDQITLPPVDVTATRIPPDTPGAPDFSITNKLPSQPAPALWMRKWDLVLQKSIDKRGGSATVSMKDFHLTFSTRTVMDQTPAEAKVTIYNIEREFAQELIQYTGMSLSGGYQHVQYGEIFFGQIIFWEFGKASPTETHLTLHAASADQVVNQGLINTNLPAGYTSYDVVNSVLQDAKRDLNLMAGHISPLSKNKCPRGRTLTGMRRDCLRDVAQSEQANVWVTPTNPPALNVVTDDDTTFKPNRVKINLSNGLVGFPSQQLGSGLHVQSLMNPALLPGGHIELNQDDVNRILAQEKAAEISPAFGAGMSLTSTASIGNGVYQIWSLQHEGDTRGTPWYTTMVTRGVNPDTMAPKVA